MRNLKFDAIVVADGSARPNPGYTGWACAVVRNQTTLHGFDVDRDVIYEAGWGYGSSVFAETQAILEGLKYVQPGGRPLIITDSRIAVHTIQTHRADYGFRLQNPALINLRQAIDWLVWTMDFDFRRYDNVVRIAGHAGEYMLHTIVDTLAGNEAAEFAALHQR